MTKPVTGDAEIRPGEKFAEDALAQTCEMQRESIRKMQTALDLQDSELRELRAARAGMMQQIETITKQLTERRVPWVAAMAAELAGKTMINDAGHFIYDANMQCRLFTITEAQQQALKIYEFFEKHFGGTK